MFVCRSVFLTLAIAAGLLPAADSPQDLKQKVAAALAGSAGSKAVLFVSDDVPGTGGVLYKVYKGQVDPVRGITWTSEESVFIPNSTQPLPLYEIQGVTLPAGAWYTPSTPAATLRGTPAEPIRNLVFSGGGILGLAYGGAVKALEDAKLMGKVERYAGASAGAISATLLAAGYDSATLLTIMKSKNFGEFLDEWTGSVDLQAVMEDISAGRFSFTDPWNLLKLTVIGGNYYNQYGICKGDAFQGWLTRMLLERGLREGITFQEFAGQTKKDLNVVIVNANLGRAFVANAKNTPDMKVTDAVRASMSIPFVFSPVKFNGDLLVDGGTMYNFPVDLFDQDGQAQTATVGFLLDAETAIRNPKRTDITNSLDFALANFGAVRGVEYEATFRNSANYGRTVFIDPGTIGALQFKLTDLEKIQLINAGETATINFLKKTGRL